MKPVDIREQWWWWRGHIREDDQTFIFKNHHPSFMLNPGSSCAVDIFCRYNFSVVERGLCRIKKITKNGTVPDLKKYCDRNYYLLLMMDTSASSVLVLLDTIDHSILLHRLEHYLASKVLLFAGLNLYSWIENKLLCEGSESKHCNLSFGIPQGSFLGPLLFFSTQFQKVESCLTAIQIWM